MVETEDVGSSALHQQVVRMSGDIEDLLFGMMNELLHLADNGFMAPEVRTAEIRRIRTEFEALQASRGE
jgi:hypothetical protein